jgi:hypothetical protein
MTDDERQLLKAMPHRHTAATARRQAGELLS